MSPGHRLPLTAGGLGLASMVLLFTPAIANSGLEPGFDAPTSAIVPFIRASGSASAQFGSFVMALGLVVWLVFAIAVVSLLRDRGGSSWRLLAAAAASIAFVATNLRSDVTAAAFRPDTDPAIARFAFDEGNMSFANAWIALGAFAALTGWEAIAVRSLPRWLGRWAVLAGVGLVAARAVWTSPFWFFPYGLFWLWVAALSITLLVGGSRGLRARPGVPS